jgi:hypothetical protein
MFEFGEFDVAMSGSGSNSDLIDAAVQQIRDEAASNSDVRDLKTLKRRLQEELSSFLKNEAVLYPPAQRDMKYIIAASAKERNEYAVWVTASSRLRDIEKHKLVGWDEELYRYSIDRLFKEDIPISRAIPLGMYLFSLARNTSTFVGGKTSVLIITDNVRMFLEEDAVVKEIEDMTEVYATALERMLLVCTDTTLKGADFGTDFSKFTRTITELRQKYFQVTAKRNILKLFAGNLGGLAYRTMPKGSAITMDGDGNFQAREGSSEEVAKIKQMIEETERLKKEHNFPAPRATDSVEPKP